MLNGLTSDSTLSDLQEIIHTSTDINAELQKCKFIKKYRYIKTRPGSSRNILGRGRGAQGSFASKSVSAIELRICLKLLQECAPPSAITIWMYV